MDNLARDAIAAQRAGLSYGQYMAQRPPSVKVDIPATERPLTHDEIICKGCGKRVIKSKPRQQYCTTECAQKTNRAKALERYHQTHKPKVIKCPICGRDVKSVWGRKYCGEECYLVARKQKTQEWRSSRA